MNHLERLLSQSEKRVKTLTKEIQEHKTQQSKLQDSYNSLHENYILQEKEFKSILELNSKLRQENSFLETDRNNLIDQIKQQQDFIISINELQQKSTFNKMKVMQELTLTRDEYTKQAQQILFLKSQNAELQSNLTQITQNNTQLKKQLISYNNQQSIERSKYESLLKERDQILNTLKERIENIEKANYQQEFIEQESFQSDDTDSPLEIPFKQVQQQEEELQLLKQQIILKEQIISQKDQQIFDYQQKLNTQQRDLNYQQIIDAVPIVLKDRIEQLIKLQKLVPLIINRVAEIEFKQQQINQQNIEIQNLNRKIVQLNNQNQEIQKQLEEFSNDNQNAYIELENLLKQNWGIKQYLLTIYNEDQVIQILNQINFQINFDDYPFENFDELLRNYNRMKQMINQQAQEQLQ